MISIIIPAYNYRTLNSAIASILKQPINSLEIIIIDDRGDNKIQKIIDNLNHPKIQYYKNSTNIGTTLSRIKGIKKSTGKYVGFLDDDDLMLNNGLVQQKELLDRSDLDFVFCNYIINNKLNNVIIKKNIYQYEKQFTQSILHSPGPFLQCCLFKQQFILQHLDSLESVAEPSEDWNFFMHISQYNPKIKHIPIVSFQWNLTQNSQSINYNKEALALQYIINKHYDYIKQYSRKSLALQYRKLGSMFYYLGQYQTAQEAFKQAFWIYPISIKNILIQIAQQCPAVISHWLMQLYVKKII